MKPTQYKIVGVLAAVISLFFIPPLFGIIAIYSGYKLLKSDKTMGLALMAGGIVFAGAGMIIGGYFNGGQLAATPSSMAAWRSGQYGSASLFTDIRGGTPPYGCTLGNGSVLPSGLSLDSNCTISGTHTLSPGSTSETSPPFTVIVGDSANPAAELIFSISITTIIEHPELVPVQGRCTVNEWCNTQIATASGGTPPYTFSSGSFASAPPMGMIIGIEGNLSGTPSAEGTYTFGVCVTDSIGSKNCTDSSILVGANATTVSTTEISTSTTTIQEQGQLAATISSAYCRYGGLDSSGTPLYIFGASGTAGGPVGSQIAVVDRSGSCSSSSCEAAETMSCSSWSLGNNDYCVRQSGQDPSTTWSGQDGNNYLSGMTITFYIRNGFQGTVLGTATAKCPSCGDNVATC